MLCVVQFFLQPDPRKKSIHTSGNYTPARAISPIHNFANSTPQSIAISTFSFLQCSYLTIRPCAPERCAILPAYGRKEIEQEEGIARQNSLNCRTRLC